MHRGMLRMRGNPWDHREHRASGELWDSTGFPSWSVSQSNGGVPGGLFRMLPQCNASSATSSDWRLLFDRVQRGTQGASSRSHSIIWLELCVMWSLLLPVNVSEEKKLWVIPCAWWTNFDGRFNWNISDVFILTVWISFGRLHYSLLLKAAVSLRNNFSEGAHLKWFTASSLQIIVFVCGVICVT